MTTEVWLVQSGETDWSLDGDNRIGERVYKFHVWKNGSTTLTRFDNDWPDHLLLNLGPRMIGVESQGLTVLLQPGCFIRMPDALGDVTVHEDQLFQLTTTA